MFARYGFVNSAYVRHGMNSKILFIVSVLYTYSIAFSWLACQSVVLPSNSEILDALSLGRIVLLVDARLRLL